MPFLHVRNIVSGAEYDAPAEFANAFPDQVNVVDPEPVVAPRPPAYFITPGSKPKRSAQKPASDPIPQEER